MMADTDDGQIWAISLYGAHSREAIVSIRWKDNIVQLSCAGAREFASNILQAAEAAEQDAFLFEWCKQEIHVDDSGAAGLLAAYREWRDNKMKGAT